MLDGVVALLVWIWESLDVHGGKTVRVVGQSSTLLFSRNKEVEPLMDVNERESYFYKKEENKGP